MVYALVSSVRPTRESGPRPRVDWVWGVGRGPVWTETSPTRYDYREVNDFDLNRSDTEGRTPTSNRRTGRLSGLTVYGPDGPGRADRAG